MPYYSAKIKADFYTSWRRLEISGIPLNIIIKQLSQLLPASSTKKWRRVSARTESGHPLSQRLLKNDFIYPWEAGLLDLGEKSGDMSAVLDYLSDYTQQRSRFLATIRKKLTYPLAIWVISLFVVPLPALARNELMIGEYLFTAFAAIGTLAGIYLLTIKIYASYRKEQLPTIMTKHLSLILHAFPAIREHCRYRYLACLSIGLSSGLPADQSILCASKCYSGSYVRAIYLQPVSLVRQGISVSEALYQTGIIDRELFGAFQSAEYGTKGTDKGDDGQRGRNYSTDKGDAII